jgi:phosphopantothenoylcysteine synthetase/decarboxylase
MLRRMRPVLLVGGAVRVAVDAVRYLSVAASGATALSLHEALHRQGLLSDLLLGIDASPAAAAERFVDRAGLESALQRWISVNPAGVVVMSAAVNDYQVAAVELHHDGQVRTLPPAAKLPSRAESVTIRLTPANKVIDRLRGWGLAGPIVGFKYEAADTVLASAAALRQRVGAELVVANSLCGQVQALVDGGGIERCSDRAALIAALVARLGMLVRR